MPGNDKPDKVYLSKNFFVKTIQLYLLALLSGLLLTFAWLPHGWIPLIFISFVPLLLVEKDVSDNPEKYHSLTLLGCSYLTFFTWNLCTTWWIVNASLAGAMLAIVCNALLMTVVFILYHRVKQRVGDKWQYIIFCSFWITWEFLHLDWDLSWPWLTLGNAFADTSQLIQWYEYTGVFGGSLWILAVNCLVVRCFEKKSATKYVLRFRKNKISVLIISIAVPVLISCLICSTFPVSSATYPTYYNVVAVQPNMDPYNDKLNSDQELEKMLKLATGKIDYTTDLLVFPEGALLETIWENDPERNKSIPKLHRFLSHYSVGPIITGALTSRFYMPNEKRSSTARKFKEDDAYYDMYNTALQISGAIQIHHKSKLVPGVEKLPFPYLFKWLNKTSILGGMTGSLGIQDEPGLFHHGRWSAAPVICYESIYGEYVGEYIRKGANFIVIITNDGWWENTSGYKQHLQYGSLRAIETRRWIVRSANTGVSCFISPEGEIQQATNWWVPAVIKGRIEMRHELTFYVKYGDYIARTALYLSALLIIYSWLIRFMIIKKS